MVVLQELQQQDEQTVDEERFRSSRNPTTRGWFYDNFVKDHTMEAKLSKFKSDVAARNGFVGSLFNDAFKYTAWIEIHRKLTERNLESIPCKEAFELGQSNQVVLLDVREPDEYEKVHVENSKSAPLFRQIQGNDLKANMRRLGYAMMTDFAGTERNPLFIEQAVEAVGGDKTKKVVVMCSIGGTLQTYVERKGPKAKRFADPERMFGRQSRSLKAAYELQEAGFTNVYHLKNGVNEWIHLDLPIAGTST
ncbi:hypothetical protein GOP47_0011236 [Adiantum capillus-veneris]|uniref:Rhodanese domain-containing protein n=1 Tax=Adiantum capillus-veneris TaxID=13818 RepID=A0A9D4ZF78_ADICA|nr:hypothetical protein GOP47_0011236 [Adiantum capillus-veneris]